MVIGLDLGTGSCKAVLVDDGGRVVGAASEGYPLRTAPDGTAEQDVAAIWDAACRALGRLAAGSLVPVRGIALSGAMHSLLAVDAAGEPRSPALTWADRRAAGLEAEVRAEVEAGELHRRTGCPVRSTYHPVRLRWMARAGLADARTSRFPAIKDWILHRMTGAWATDTSLASTTGLLDIRTGGWDPEALALAGVGPQRLPVLVPPASVVGGLTAQAAAASGLAEGLPVIAGGSDGAMATIGAGTRDGDSVITVGTSGAVRRPMPAPWLDPHGRTWCYLLDEGRWLAGGAINNAGLAVEWVRRVLYGELPEGEGYRRLAEDAGRVEAGAEGLVVIPHLAGERSPTWAAADTARMHGLRLDHRRAHVARAVLEGVAHCLADVWEALPEPGPGAAVTALTGGITRSPAWVQILADVLGVPLRVDGSVDASALGAARTGLRGIGRDPGPPAPPVGDADAPSGPRADGADGRHDPGPDHAIHLARRPLVRALRDLDLAAGR